MFTSSGVFTVPKGVKEIEVFAVGNGANGGGVYGGASEIHAGKGGNGGRINCGKIRVNQGNNIDISIGDNTIAVYSDTSKITTEGGYQAMGAGGGWWRNYGTGYYSGSNADDGKQSFYDENGTWYGGGGSGGYYLDSDGGYGAGGHAGKGSGACGGGGNGGSNSYDFANCKGYTISPTAGKSGIAIIRWGY